MSIPRFAAMKIAQSEECKNFPQKIDAWSKNFKNNQFSLGI